LLGSLAARVSRDEEGVSGEVREQVKNSSVIGRIAAVVALAVAVVAVFVLLSGGEEEYSVTAEFQNAGQLVNGNEVVVGGTAVGTVKEIELGPEGQAMVSFSVGEEYAPLRRGTTATIRSPSLSQIAGRQVQLTIPADSTAGEEIEAGGTLTSSETVSAVDLDQLFNTLSPKTIKDFKHVIQGFELSYDGVGEQANKGLRYLNPFLSTSRRLFGELTSDQAALERLIVDTSKLSGALAERSTDISALVGNLNRMMNAIGDRKERLAAAIAQFPDFMRQANTTFVNLRAALDDVDPLVDASKPVAVELRPFLAKLRTAADDAVPTIRDLDAILRRRGKANDLVELALIQPKLTDVAVGSGSPDCGPGTEDPEDLQIAADDDYTQGSFGEAVCSLTNGETNLEFFRAYTPELVGWFDDFGHSGAVDGFGGIGRIATTFNTFSVSNPGGFPDLTQPLTPDELFASLDTDNNRRCPGGNERPVSDIDPSDTSVPFTDGGALTDGEPGDCDPSHVLPGP
jgi:phospholipid/cholesterol/gamma-HCH transport system substrate-binding protein